MALLLARNDSVLGAEAETQLAQPTNRWWRNLRAYCHAKEAGTVDDLEVTRLKPQQEVAGAELLDAILAAVPDEDLDEEEQVDTVSELTVTRLCPSTFAHLPPHNRRTSCPLMAMMPT